MVEVSEWLSTLRHRIQYTLFGDESPYARLVDITVIVAILASVLVVMLESIPRYNAAFGWQLHIAEWVFTIIFTVEYLFRLLCAKRPKVYARSFYGIVDLMAVVPTYISFFLPGAETLLVIRLLRLLRVFRILKLVAFLDAGNVLIDVLKQSARSIAIFLTAVFVLVTILGSLIYLVEGAENGYDTIPRSIYWAVVTLTTVGYGDISPQTPLGQALAAVVMVIGYSIIAVPAGIVSLGFSRAIRPRKGGKVCTWCHEKRHDPKAQFCHNCGTKLIT